MQWISGDDMPSDLFTKNLPAPLFEKHASRYVGFNEYMRTLSAILKMVNSKQGECWMTSLATYRRY